MKFAGNISGFLYIGEAFPAQQLWTNNTYIHRGGSREGYDGQFYYYAAHDPLILTDTYRFIDSPAYRYQRLMYPLIAHIISFGHKPLLPYVLILLNISAVAGGAYLIARICKANGISTWYALFFSFSTGLLLSTLRDLTEPLAIFFMVWGLYHYLQNCTYKALLPFSLGVLTKETILLVPISLFCYKMATYFYEMLRKYQSNKPVYLGEKIDIAGNMSIGIIPSLLYFIWQLYIYAKFNRFSFEDGAGNIGIPFKDMFNKLLNLFSKVLDAHTYNTSTYNAALVLFEIFLTMLVLSTIIVIILSLINARNELAFLGSIYALFISLFTKLIWIDYWSYGRVTVELFTIVLICFITSGKKIFIFPLIGYTVSFWFVVYGLLR